MSSASSRMTLNREVLLTHWRDEGPSEGSGWTGALGGQQGHEAQQGCEAVSGTGQCQAQAQTGRQASGEQLSRKGPRGAGDSRLSVSQQSALADEGKLHFGVC